MNNKLIIHTCDVCTPYTVLQNVCSWASIIIHMTRVMVLMNGGVAVAGACLGMDMKSKDIFNIIAA